MLARTPAEIQGTQRMVLGGEWGDFLLMPAIGSEGAGAKLLTVGAAPSELAPARINGLYVLFSGTTLAPEALIDGAALTRLRTAAVSALAARHLARDDCDQLVLFGAGAQAEPHVEALCQVLPITGVTIVARSATSPRASDLRERLRARGLDAAIGSPTDVEHADVVCTCTTSTTPVFDSRRLAEGTHVCAIGAYTREMCELDLDLFDTAVLVVETRSSARREAGDVIRALDAGRLGRPNFAHELRDVLAGKVHPKPGQITVFKSVGLPVEDLIIARAAVDRLKKVARDSPSQ